jgi:hypothetical protein
MGGTGSGRPATAATPSGRRQPARPQPMGHPLEGRSIRMGTAPGRDEAADAVSRALEELPDRFLDFGVMSHLGAVPRVHLMPLQGHRPWSSPLPRVALPRCSCRCRPVS